jgi:hypothetical protein
MNTPERATAAGPSLTEEWLRALRYRLSGRRGLIALAVLLVVGGLAFNWSLLVAAGIAPLVISVLPCVAMCALGLCMSKAMGGACSGEKDAGAATLGPPPEALPAAAADPNQLTLDLGGGGSAAQPTAVAPAAPAGVARTQTTEVEERTHA